MSIAATDRTTIRPTGTPRGAGLSPGRSRHRGV